MVAIRCIGVGSFSSSKGVGNLGKCYQKDFVIRRRLRNTKVKYITSLLSSVIIVSDNLFFIQLYQNERLGKNNAFVD